MVTTIIPSLLFNLDEQREKNYYLESEPLKSTPGLELGFIICFKIQLLKAADWVFCVFLLHFYH